MKTTAQNKFQKGFTLIELLVVIAILAVLAVVVLVVINPGNRIASSKNARVKADLASIGRSATLFYSDSSSTPSCTPAGSYPQAFGATNTGCSPAVSFMPSLNDPDGNAYTLVVNGASAGCTSAGGTNPCTSFAVYGPAYSDGIIVTTTNNKWCWRSTTGTVVQTTVALCTAP